MSRRTFIYLIEARSGEVKIGCSEQPELRLHAIAQASPCEVRLIAMWRGPFKEEGDLHRLFSEFRVYREWFKPEGALTEFVEAKRSVGVGPIASWGGAYAAEAAARKAAKSRRLSEANKANWADPEFRAERARWREITKARAQA